MSPSQPIPENNGPDCSPDSTNSPLFFFDGPGDTTVRPLRPSLRKAKERQKRPPQPPEQGEPPSSPA